MTLKSPKGKTEQRDGSVTKKQKNDKPPKQTTLFLDADVYEGLMIGKAKGHGSLKDQLNEAARLLLHRRQVAAWEEQERRVWAEKPWNEQDEAEIRMFDGVRALEPDDDWSEYDT